MPNVDVPREGTFGKNQGVLSMPLLFGQHYNQLELQKRVGHLSQLAGVRLMQLQDGKEAGVKVADVRTGSGLRFQISLDRGMDISLAEYKGLPLAWRSANGDVHPSFYDAKGLGWSRSFPGGLMTGCGLTHLGAPCIDEGEELGLHGRLSNTPASDVSTTTEWVNGKCRFTVEGQIRESSLFGDNLLLHRTIETALGESTITLHDTVKNEGVKRSPFMMLYHINTGWPLIDDGAQLLLNAAATKPRDAEAEQGATAARHLSHPVAGYKEQVFFHDLNANTEGHSVVLLVNKKLSNGLFVKFRQKELPRFIQWKMMGEGTYVLGLEPANCWVQGRVKEKERGTLHYLEPGEERKLFVQIGVIEGIESLQTFSQGHHLQ